MSRIKDLIIDRENYLSELIRKMSEYDRDDIFDAWCELGLPYDDEDYDVLFDIVTEEDRWEYVIKTAEEFLSKLEQNKA